MPINQLVTFCHQSINKNGKCVACAQTCQNNCNICLQECHFGSPRGYDCNNMIYCYTCSYIYKYASEIGHIFNLINLGRFGSFNILNLGCGSCADLFGINKYLQNGGINIPVTYTGVDSNMRWTATHNTIINLFPNYNINFVQSDIFDFLNGIEDNQELEYNIVILQYILNEFLTHCPERIDEFIQLFVSKIINNLPDKSIVVINDINLNNVRSISARIFQSSLVHNLTAQFMYRFRNPLSHTYGGDMHGNDNILFNVPVNISNNYDVKSPCSSAQSLIFKTRNR